jgi:hypothetical protein
MGISFVSKLNGILGLVYLGLYSLELILFSNGHVVYLVGLIGIGYYLRALDNYIDKKMEIIK